MNEKGYNGWSNYETWAVNLWLNNDEGTYHDLRDMARHARSEQDLAGQLKAYVEDLMPDLGSTLASDLLSAALSEVDWYELACSYLEDEEGEKDKEEEEEEEETEEAQPVSE